MHEIEFLAWNIKSWLFFFKNLPYLFKKCLNQYVLHFAITFRLNSIDEHVKNYAPQILALTGPPNARPALVHLANLITKNNSLLISGEIFPVCYLDLFII